MFIAIVVNIGFLESPVTSWYAGYFKLSSNTGASPLRAPALCKACSMCVYCMFGPGFAGLCSGVELSRVRLLVSCVEKAHDLDKWTMINTVQTRLYVDMYALLIKFV